MKPRRKRIVRSLELDEVSAVGTPAVAGALHAITKSEPEPVAPTVADMAKALRGATPEALEIVKQQIESHARLLEELKKFNNPEEPETMPTDPNHFYNEAVRTYAEKHNLPIAKAATEIISNRPDLVEAAYAADQQTAVQREQAKVAKLYGTAA